MGRETRGCHKAMVQASDFFVNPFMRKTIVQAVRQAGPYFQDLSCRQQGDWGGAMAAMDLPAKYPIRFSAVAVVAAPSLPLRPMAPIGMHQCTVLHSVAQCGHGAVAWSGCMRPPCPCPAFITADCVLSDLHIIHAQAVPNPSGLGAGGPCRAPGCLQAAASAAGGGAACPAAGPAPPPSAATHH
ncbi:hypothetical protein HaLaN_13973 [Haematococcus lacustris]|uniref:Uncharacterized protein n=1 Tax=Haematococcus lacustris TaxID=44745 RepID=A0A699Z702_HAELA|nr:hypothetical protein HaLaN_13973 [Haematococcus lacustris]